jgi:Skp family chaperone for outer membrane proteins
MSTTAATPEMAPAATTETSAAADNSNLGATAQSVPVSQSDASVDEYELSLEDLAAADFGNDPAMQGTHKGIPDYKKILEHIPENGRKLVQNLRASYTQKTQEIAELKRALESEKQNLQKQRELLSESEFAKNVREIASKPVESDPWSDEGLQERINQKAAQMMQQMLEPLQQDLEVQKRQAALDSFKVKHPDMTSDELRVPIAKLLMERPELKLEDAYYLVKGQKSIEQSAQEKQVRQVQKEVLKKTSTGNAVRNAQPPKFKSAWEAYQYHKANGTK